MTELVKKIKDEISELDETDLVNTLELIVLCFVFISCTLAIAPIV